MEFLSDLSKIHSVQPLPGPPIGAPGAHLGARRQRPGVHQRRPREPLAGLGTAVGGADGDRRGEGGPQGLPQRAVDQLGGS